MQLINFLLLTLTLLTSSTLAFPTISLSSLLARQTTTPSTKTCADYSQTANYTAIGSNSTLRAAFIQSSPDGTDPTRAILDTAMKKYAANNMLNDEALNRLCGNMSTIASAEVGRNYTRGLVAGFPLKLTKATFAQEGLAVGLRVRGAWVGTVVLVVVGIMVI